MDIFYEEKKGVVPDKTWKKQNLGESWMVGETLSAGIGQGFFLTSSAQLSLALAQIVNGGKKLTPSIIVNQKDHNLQTKYDSRLIANASHLEIVKQSLNSATNLSGGTSYRSRIIGDFKMGGKTGTSQVRIISQHERDEGIIKKINVNIIHGNEIYFHNLKFCIIALRLNFLRLFLVYFLEHLP